MFTRSRALPVVAVLVALVVAVATFWALKPSPGPVKASAPPMAAPPPLSRSFREGARTPIPRPVKTNVAAAEAPAPPTTPAGTSNSPPAPLINDDEPAAGGPVDKRESPGPEGAATVTRIKEKMDGVTDEIAECLGEWMALDPALEGEVAMGFRIGPDGLQEAWVVDHSEVPFGPLSCFGAAIHSADWSGVSEQPVEVTFPFTFSPEPE